MKKLIEARLGDTMYFVTKAGFVEQEEVTYISQDYIQADSKCRIEDRNLTHGGVVSTKIGNSVYIFATLDERKALTLAIGRSTQLLKSHQDNLLELTKRLSDV